MTSGTKQSVLQKLLFGHQRTLEAELVRGRESHTHGGMKGEASEEQWRDMLGRHLPRRYRVCKGMVVDSHGGCSDQIDVIIHDANFCPLFLESGGSCFVPAESVYAVFEVKQELTSQYVVEAGQKAASVRALHRTSTRIIDCGVEQPARKLHHILGGALSLTTVWNGSLSDGFVEALSRLDPESTLDLGCALRAGAFEHAQGFQGPTIYPPETALVAFFLRLVHRLQCIGTVPAIDWAAYFDAALPTVGVTD